MVSLENIIQVILYRPNRLYLEIYAYTYADMYVNNSGKKEAMDL